MPAVVIEPYDERWPHRAAALLGRLRDVLGPLVLFADHIGSTAVPGMAAKPVLDLQLSVRDLDEAAEAFADPLTGLGFVRSSFERDHVPAGAPDRPEDWAKRLWGRGKDHPDGPVHLHVRRVGSPNERVALLFRDWLRSEPAAVLAYSAVKRRLAAALSDSAVYAETKDPVVDLVLAAAEPWARTTGWRPHS